MPFRTKFMPAGSELVIATHADGRWLGDIAIANTMIPEAIDEGCLADVAGPPVCTLLSRLPHRLLGSEAAITGLT